MGKDLGVGISQRKNGLYTARFTDRLGKRRQQYFKNRYYREFVCPCYR